MKYTAMVSIVLATWFLASMPPHSMTVPSAYMSTLPAENMLVMHVAMFSQSLL